MERFCNTSAWLSYRIRERTGKIVPLNFKPVGDTGQDWVIPESHDQPCSLTRSGFAVAPKSALPKRYPSPSLGPFTCVAIGIIGILFQIMVLSVSNCWCFCLWVSLASYTETPLCWESPSPPKPRDSPTTDLDSKNLHSLLQTDWNSQHQRKGKSYNGFGLLCVTFQGCRIRWNL